MISLETLFSPMPIPPREDEPYGDPGSAEPDARYVSEDDMPLGAYDEDTDATYSDLTSWRYFASIHYGKGF